MKFTQISLILMSAYLPAQYTGNVGIGTPAPEANLHVKGTLRLENPSKAADAVLRVYKDGSMKWKKLLLVEPITGQKELENGINTSTTPKYSGLKITLPTGRWIVKLNLLIPPVNYSTNQGLWVNCYLSDSSTNSTATTDYLTNSSTYFGGGMRHPANYGMVVGGVVINNTSASSKTYYLWASHEAFPSTANISANTLGGYGWYEDKIYALPFE